MTPANKNAAKAAIECEIKSGKTPEASFEFILAGALAASRTGPVTRWFFEDAGWRHGDGNPPAARSQRIRENIINGVTADLSRRQRDFDERDWRKLQAALSELYRSLEGARIFDSIAEAEAAGSGHSHEEIRQRACQRAGITAERARELLSASQAEETRARKKLPQAVND